MKVIQLGTFKEIQACVKFNYKGHEVSVSTDQGRPWLIVFKGESNAPLWMSDVMGEYDMFIAMAKAKEFIDNL